MRSSAVACTALAAVALAATVAPAKEARRHSAKQLEPAVEVAPPPMDEGGSAVASCKKHVESMLHESAETRFPNDGDIRIQHSADGNYDVAGWVTSKTNGGTLRRGDFNCHASRFGGGLWTTKTSLSFDR